MPDSNRFARLWETWDSRLGGGETRTTFLASAKDEELIELLAGESARNRRLERDVIATEILNRLHRRNTTIPGGADGVVAAAASAHLAAQAGQAAIHASETLLHAAGEHTLGQSVSESAYESLDLAKASLTAAQDHAANVQINLAQSRLGADADASGLAKAESAADAASAAAHRGSDITDDLEQHMAKIGSADVGRASAEAGQSIARAADASAEGAHATHAKQSRLGPPDDPN